VILKFNFEMDELSFEKRLKLSKDGYENRKDLIINPEKKRKDDDAPLETSSKMLVPRFQNIKLVKKQKENKKRPIDPRFTSYATEKIRGAYETPYAFLDDMRRSELEKLYEMRRQEDLEDWEFDEIQKKISKLVKKKSKLNFSQINCIKMKRKRN
jgi:hypothetical protein